VAAAILTLVVTAIVSGAAWLMLGNRLRLSADERQNDIANLASYAVVLLPIAFVIVFFAMGRW
jgi:Na+/H+ antiporter NhaC